MKITRQMKTSVGIRELALVDHEPRVDLVAGDGIWSTVITFPTGSKKETKYETPSIPEFNSCRRRIGRVSRCIFRYGDQRATIPDAKNLEPGRSITR